MAEGVGELHLAIVVDCSPESLSEDIARGSFGRESPSTRLEALIDVARDYAASSRASAATVLACDPSKGARVTYEKNVAVVVPPRRVTADDALFRDADRALGLVDDDGRRREIPAPPPGAPLHACLALAAMALRRCERADPRATRGIDGAPPSPTRRVLVLLASDPDSIAAAPLALAPALAKLRAIGARRDVLHVAPPPRHVRASLHCREDAQSTRREDDRSTLAETLQCISDDDGACFARVNGASIGRARCSPAGALTFAATTTSSDRGGEEDADEYGEPAGVHLARPMDAPFTPHERPRDECPRDERPRDERPRDERPRDEHPRRGVFAADSSGRCRGQHGAFYETVLAAERARGTTGRVESREEATSGAWRINVDVDVFERDDDETTRARVVGEDGVVPPRPKPERRCVRVAVDPDDVPKALAALTRPIVDVRAGRMLARSVDPITRSERVSLAPDPRTTGTESRLRLCLRADGSLRLTHAHPRSDPPREETLANISADRAARFRAAAAADRDAKTSGRAAPVDRSGRSEVRARLPGDASRRAFFLTLGAGAGKRRFYFWSQEPTLRESESALHRLESALRDPPTFTDASGVPPERLHALAAAAPALARAFADPRANPDRDTARMATALANAWTPTRTLENSFQHSGWFEHTRVSERVSERVHTRVPAPAATKPPKTTGERGPGAVLAPVSRERRRVDARRPPIGEHHVERNDETSVTTRFAPISSSSALAWVPPTAPAGTRVTSSNVARFFARGRENAAHEGEEDDDEDARGE